MSAPGRTAPWKGRYRRLIRSVSASVRKSTCFTIQCRGRAGKGKTRRCEDGVEACQNYIAALISAVVMTASRMTSKCPFPLRKKQNPSGLPPTIWSVCMLTGMQAFMRRNCPVITWKLLLHTPRMHDLQKTLDALVGELPLCGRGRRSERYGLIQRLW